MGLEMQGLYPTQDEAARPRSLNKDSTAKERDMADRDEIYEAALIGARRNRNVAYTRALGVWGVASNAAEAAYEATSTEDDRIYNAATAGAEVARDARTRTLEMERVKADRDDALQEAARVRDSAIEVEGPGKKADAEYLQVCVETRRAALKAYEAEGREIWGIYDDACYAASMAGDAGHAGALKDRDAARLKSLTGLYAAYGEAWEIYDNACRGRGSL